MCWKCAGQRFKSKDGKLKEKARGSLLSCDPIVVHWICHHFIIPVHVISEVDTDDGSDYSKSEAVSTWMTWLSGSSREALAFPGCNMANDLFITNLPPRDGCILLSLIVTKCKPSPMEGDNCSSAYSHCNFDSCRCRTEPRETAADL